MTAWRVHVEERTIEVIEGGAVGDLYSYTVDMFDRLIYLDDMVPMVGVVRDQLYRLHTDWVLAGNVHLLHDGTVETRDVIWYNIQTPDKLDAGTQMYWRLERCGLGGRFHNTGPVNTLVPVPRCYSDDDLTVYVPGGMAHTNKLFYGLNIACVIDAHDPRSRAIDMVVSALQSALDNKSDASVEQLVAALRAAEVFGT